ncbi:MAG: substrate-binding domain-containing protein [Planctomycetota bacterium]
MSPALQLNRPFPAKGASQVLRERLELFLRESATPGDRFLTDAAVVKLSQLSRSTVRRAMDELQREGLIEREIGRGTFVGPAVLLDRANQGGIAMPERSRGSVRLAVVVFWNHPHLSDWYTPQILRGIDSAAESERLTVELMGQRDTNVDAVVRRLQRDKPDALACLLGAQEQLPLISEARRLDIPVLLAGTDAMEPTMPTVAEDNRQGITLAVEHLLAQGHTRIGLALPARPARWVFDRAAAYRSVLRERGGLRDENLVHWHELDAPLDASADAYDEYLDRAKPTAVILGNRTVAHAAELSFNRRGISVPDDLSVIKFDEDPDAPQPIAGTPSTCIGLPLEAMGRELARMARLQADGVKLEQETRLPCSLIQGESVAHLA